VSHAWSGLESFLYARGSELEKTKQQNKIHILNYRKIKEITKNMIKYSKRSNILVITKGRIFLLKHCKSQIEFFEK
jgi:hypothetical protein